MKLLTSEITKNININMKNLITQHAKDFLEKKLLPPVGNDRHVTATA